MFETVAFLLIILLFFGCFGRIGAVVVPAPLGCMVFMNSLCYFSSCWNGGLHVIKSSGSELPTEKATLWPPSILLRLEGNLNHGACKVFPTNRLQHTELHLFSSKCEQDASFTCTRARSQLFRLKCVMQKMTASSKQMYIVLIFHSLPSTTTVINICLDCCIGFNQHFVAEVCASK